MDRLDILNSIFFYIHDEAPINNINRRMKLAEPHIERYFTGVLRDLGVHNATSESEQVTLMVDFPVLSTELGAEPYLGHTQEIMAQGIQDVITSGISNSIPAGSGLRKIELNEVHGVSGFQQSPYVIFRTRFDITYDTIANLEASRIKQTNIGQEVGMFGSEFYQVEDPDETVYSSSSLTTHLQLDIEDLPFGNYRIGYSFEWSALDAGDQPVFAVVLDGEDDEDDAVMYITSYDVAGNGTSDYVTMYHAGGFQYVTIGEGDHTIELQVASPNSTDIKIRKARLEFWRVDG